MDTFFLRGQQLGVFRIDMPAPVLTEIWGSLISGLIDAERRGRVAKAGLHDLLEKTLLQGVAAK